MPDNDLISVIMPVKNGSKYLETAINGIKNQGMNVEIIVVDDCSDDNTAEIAQHNGCKVIKHTNPMGQVIGKNNGLKSAKGKYILFHDHDDIMRDGSLKELYDEISADETISAVEAKLQDFYSPDMSEEERNKTKIKNEAYWGLFTGAILMRKSIFDKIGLFNEKFKAGEIIDWQNKMNLCGLKIKKTDLISADRRIHAANFGRTEKTNEFKDYAAILRARLQAKK